jgi:hypothetical protein
MTRDSFADNLVLAVKDQLRNVRFHIRRSAQRDRLRETERGIPQVPLPVALAADAVFAQVETAATALLPDRSQRSTGLDFPLSVDAYLGPQAEERGENFTFAFYYALKGLLRRFGAPDSLVFEQAVEDAHSRILRRHGDLAAADRGAAGERAAAVTRLCAIIAVELSAARPIKALLLDPGAATAPKHLIVSPNAYCACVLGLSTAIASLRVTRPGEPEAGNEQIVASADYAVDARFSRFAAVLRHRDPIGGMAEEFAAVLPFLP